MLKTASGSPFYFSFHHGDVGNTFICGPVGGGKTSLLISCCQREALGAHVLFDKDRGAEIVCRAVGGVYLVAATTAPTGWRAAQGAEPSPARTSPSWPHWCGDCHRRLTYPLTVPRRTAASIQGLRIAGAPAAGGTVRSGAARLSRRGRPGGHWRAAGAMVPGAPFGWVLDGEHDEIDLTAR